MLLGIDIGTTGVKAAVFDSSGERKGYAFREYGVSCPRHGYAEQDAEEIWNYTKAVIRESCAESGPRVTALSLSVQGDAAIPLDKDWNPLAYAQLGMDYRGTEEARWFTDTFGDEELFYRTGMRPHPMNFLVKVLWFKNHQPELYKKTYKFTTYADFILGKLGTGIAVIDETMASRTMAFNLKEKTWDRELLGACGIPAGKLSAPVPSGTRTGKIDPGTARELGINPDAILVAGGHDQTCAAVGAGIMEENLALDSHGTAEVISTAFRTPKLERTMFESYYPCYLHAVPDMYFTFSLNHTGGVLLKWFVENFCHQDILSARARSEQVYTYVFDHFSEKPSPLIVLPYFNGSGTPTCNLDLKGAFLGLTLSTSRYDIAKAIVESLSYELKVNLETMRKAGIHIRELRSVGGGARSPVGLQNKADILGIPVSTLKIREAACLGAAILAGAGTGVYDTVQQAASVIKTDRTFFPDPGAHDAYFEKYSIYSKLYDIMKPFLETI